VLSDEIALPCAQALLAGTLALMSAYAAPLAGATGPSDTACRTQMARKIVENLFFLREHPGLAPPMRSVVTKLHVHWSTLADSARAMPTSSAAATPRPGAAARLH
jgi:hypothetical protein